MDRFIQIFSFVALLMCGSIPLCDAQTPALTPQRTLSDGQNTTAQDAASLRPPVETAAFVGVFPGTTTVEKLTQLWGEPIEETDKNDQVFRRYSLDVFDHIEVTLRGGIVRRIVIQLESPFPEKDVRASLKEELLGSKPVKIPDEDGNIIGEIFPEKGVMFLFAPQKNPQELLVQQIGIDPVSADPFVLRAEAMLYDQPTEAKKDLQDALRLKSDHAKAYWLLAQVELMAGHVESALLYNKTAIELDEQKPAYHLTFAQALIQMNRVEEAKQYLQESIEICDRYPHEQAKALMMLGELYRTSRNPDFALAYTLHHQATELAKTLLKHNNQTIRLTAKDVLFESHLATAKVIAWGHWDDKEEAIQKWIGNAKILARDSELMAAKRYSREYQFKIVACELATLVSVPEKLNIDLYIENVVDEGNKLIKFANDPILRAKYYWDTGISLYDAVQIFLLRQQFSSASKYGEIAARYLEYGMTDRNSDADRFLLGRLYFRLGAIHAVGNRHHRAAIEWYDLAKPEFEKLIPKIDTGALGFFGETLVSMGVSYWETAQQEEAIRITERGIRQLERGVLANVLEASVLEIPYKNLAKMYHEKGDQEQATKYMRLAASIGAEEKRIR